MELARRCSDLDADFVMAGRVQQADYEPQLQEALKNIPNFSWVGHVDSTQVGAQFSKAHLMICTSISEGFSNTFIEAWMHGVPVVSLGVDTGAYLRDKGLGVCVSTMDALEQAVRKLIANREERQKMGALAYRTASQDFLLQNNVDRLEKMFAARGIQLPR
jgi:glycosyltransferase involved in cell wall biosynthesis